MREPDDKPHPLQLELLSRMPAEHKVALWNDLTRTTLELRFATLAEEHPRESEGQLLRRLAGQLYGEELARRAYGDPT